MSLVQSQEVTALRTRSKRPSASYPFLCLSSPSCLFASFCLCWALSRKKRTLGAVSTAIVLGCCRSKSVREFMVRHLPQATYSAKRIAWRCVDVRPGSTSYRRSSTVGGCRVTCLERTRSAQRRCGVHQRSCRRCGCGRRGRGRLRMVIRDREVVLLCATSAREQRADLLDLALNHLLGRGNEFVEFIALLHVLFVPLPQEGQIHHQTLALRAVTSTRWPNSSCEHHFYRLLTFTYSSPRNRAIFFRKNSNSISRSWICFINASVLWCGPWSALATDSRANFGQATYHFANSLLCFPREPA